MRWVNETLPPRARRRWLLITMRLSIISFAGIGAHARRGRHREARVHVRREGLRHALRAGRPRLRGRASAMIGCGLVTGTSAGTGVVRGATEVVRAAGVWPIDRDRASVAGAGVGLSAGAGAGRRRARSGAAGCGRSPGAGARRSAGCARRRGIGCRRSSAAGAPDAAACSGRRRGTARAPATTTCRRSSCRRGTSRTSRRRATRWLRIRPTPSRRIPLRSIGSTQPIAHSLR